MTKLQNVCPACGDGDGLESAERVTVYYGIRVPAGWTRDDGQDPTYTSRDTATVEPSTAEWDGSVRCRVCLWSGHWQDLRVPMTRPAPQGSGEHQHAYPRKLQVHTKCAGCGERITYDGWDEPDDFRDAFDIWSHDDTGDYWC